MAIYHLTAKTVSRGKGQSVVAKAAYNARTRLEDTGDGKTHDYSRREGLLFQGIFAPATAPSWVKDRQKLWEAVEHGEKRRDAQLAREIEISLPHELTDEQREWLVKDFVREAFVRKGMVADVCIHAPSEKSDARNHHAHILLTMREIGADGFGPKVREWNRTEQLKEWRGQWEHLANRHLERHGHQARIDARSLEAQGADREATIHMGPSIAATAAKGRSSARVQRQEEIRERNIQRARLRAELKAVNRGLASRRDADKREPAKTVNQRTGPAPLSSGRIPAREMGHVGYQGLRVSSGIAGRATDTLGNVVDGFLDGLVGTPKPKKTVADFLKDREARRELYAQMGAARQRDDAMDRMAEDIRAGRHISRSDVAYLNRDELLGIKQFGDDHLKSLLAERERDRELKWGAGGRERERERERDR